MLSAKPYATMLRLLMHGKENLFSQIFFASRGLSLAFGEQVIVER